MPNSQQASQQQGTFMADETRINMGAMHQRIVSLEGSQRDVMTAVATLSARVESLFGSLNAKIEERSRPQYGLLVSLGVFGLSVITAVGWLAYSPIQSQQQDAKLILARLVESYASLPERFVTIRELDARATRTQTEITRLAADLRQLDGVTVPRGEHSERWRSFEAQDAGLQRQIDDLRRQFGDTFSLRDALIQMQRRLDGLEGRAGSR